MRKNNWYMFIVNGLIAILFGILLFLHPDVIVNLTKYFGILILAGGAIMLVIAISNMKKEKPHALLLAEALAAILIGAVIAFYPKNTLQIFMVMIGIWATIIGLMQIIMAIQMKNKVSNHQIFTINGVITLVFGLLLFFNPMGGVRLLLYLIALLALASGVLLIYLGIKVKGAKASA
jgi:uncharacterized membrane protein HdeD (DUF308 family)